MLGGKCVDLYVDSTEVRGFCVDSTEVRGFLRGFHGRSWIFTWIFTWSIKGHVAWIPRAFYH